VLHHPTGACFRYDDIGGLTLLNAAVVPPNLIPLVTEGAAEAMCDELERDLRDKPQWSSPAGRKQRSTSTESQPSIVDLLAMPDAELVEFEPEPLRGPISRAPDLS